jgi:hypothetical protein
LGAAPRDGLHRGIIDDGEIVSASTEPPDVISDNRRTLAAKISVDRTAGRDSRRSITVFATKPLPLTSVSTIFIVRHSQRARR